MTNAYIYLLFGILSETAATSALKASDTFGKLWPSVIVVTGYGSALFCLSYALQTIGVGLAYALWSGIGICIMSSVGAFYYGEKIDAAAVLGIGMILGGVIILNLYSDVVPH